MVFFFLVTLAAVYFGLVRWLVVHSRYPMLRGPGEAWQEYLAAGILCAVLSVLAVPFLLMMAESLVGLAGVIVRRPPVQRWLRRRRSDGDQRQPR